VAETTAVSSRSATLLQILMRERHLTREQTIDVLDRRARQMDIKNFALSLRQLDRWLAQDVGDPRAVRCRVVAAEFGFPVERLLSPVQHVDQLDDVALHSVASPIEHFGAVVAHLGQIDHQRGARDVLESATAVYRGVLATMAHSTGRDRQDGLRLAARCAELVGWLHQDAGLAQEARQWTVQALDLAEAGDAQSLIAYILMRRSAIAADLGQPDQALLLGERAVRQATGGIDRALVLREIATAHALKGDEEAMRRAIDGALDSINETDDAQSVHAPYCSVAYIQSEAGAAALAVGDPVLALDYLEPAAAAWPTDQPRDRAVTLARLALANADTGELDRAEVIALEACDAVVGCGSSRFSRTLRAALDLVRERGGAERISQLPEELLSLA